MLNDYPCIGPSRVHSKASVNSQQLLQRSSVSCSATTAVDLHPAASPSIDVVFRKPRKRVRSQEDIDGDKGEHKPRKKRRLRLDLVTSRLSRPYAAPATHIIGTKSWRAGIWARQRFAGGKLLRKAAILNWIAMKSRRGPSDAMETGECRAERATPRLSPSTTVSQFPRRTFAAPAAFQVPSNYDAFDYEDNLKEGGEEDDEGVEAEEEEEDEEEEEEEEEAEGEEGARQTIHSDFRRLECSDTDPEFFDTSWSFANIGADNPEFDSPAQEIKLVMENERQDEVSIAPPGHGMFPLMQTRIPVTGI